MFQWQADYSVGHVTIDMQHQRLFQLADELFNAMASGKGNVALGSVLSSLVSYTKLHFAAEERLMQESHYPDYPRHKKEHDELTAQVAAFQKDFAAHRVAMTVDLMHFLKDWLAHHIKENDKKIGQYLRETAA